jgi:hypothetical protein
LSTDERSFTEPRADATASEPDSATTQSRGRYGIRATKGGRFLVCREAPGVAVRIDPAASFGEAEARKLGERVILIDGVGQFGPLFDNTRQVYNLDHHEGCIRSVTLASCEQALVLVLQGLELDRADWTVYANEPDLDTIFAIWVLLNHRRIPELGPQARDVLLPLIRLEGAIDANGAELAEFCGLRQETLRESQAILDRLFERARGRDSLAADGSPVDLLEFTLGMLIEIDQLVYSTDDLRDFADVEQEYGHVDIGHDRVAVVGRDPSGIYEVERRLKRVWGERLGLIALEKRPGHYTLRRVSSVGRVGLRPAYERLNLLDPAIDGRPPEKRWGGSDDIGGSPRPDGSGLTPEKLIKVLEVAYRNPTLSSRARSTGLALLVTAGLLAGSTFATLHWPYPPQLGGVTAAASRLAVLSLLIAVSSWVLSAILSRQRLWLFGWRRPAGKAWLALGPIAAAGGVLGGAWLPAEMEPQGGPLVLAAVVLAAVAAESWFRALVHGTLILEWRVQRVGGPWFVSGPSVVSALLYALTLLALSPYWIAGPALPVPEGVHPAWLVAAGGLLAGLALGVLRERSLSIWPGVVAQVAGAAGAWLLQLRLGG